MEVAGCFVGSRARIPTWPHIDSVSRGHRRCSKPAHGRPPTISLRVHRCCPRYRGALLCVQLGPKSSQHSRRRAACRSAAGRVSPPSGRCPSPQRRAHEYAARRASAPGLQWQRTEQHDRRPQELCERIETARRPLPVAPTLRRREGQRLARNMCGDASRRAADAACASDQECEAGTRRGSNLLRVLRHHSLLAIHRRLGSSCASAAKAAPATHTPNADPEVWVTRPAPSGTLKPR